MTNKIKVFIVAAFALVVAFLTGILALIIAGFNYLSVHILLIAITLMDDFFISAWLIGLIGVTATFIVLSIALLLTIYILYRRRR